MLRSGNHCALSEAGMNNRIITTLVAFSPWILAMYLLFRLDAGGVWTAETAGRDVMTIAILVAGMALTFLLLTFFSRKK